MMEMVTMGILTCAKMKGIQPVKQPVKSLPLTYHHSEFYRLDAIPVTQPTVTKH